MKLKIQYTFEGEEQTLTYDPEADRWTGGQPGFARLLNEAFADVVGRHEYYPTPWHRVKHLADVLGGTVDQPMPSFESGNPEEGKVF